MLILKLSILLCSKLIIQQVLFYSLKWSDKMIHRRCTYFLAKFDNSNIPSRDMVNFCDFDLWKLFLQHISNFLDISHLKGIFVFLFWLIITRVIIACHYLWYIGGPRSGLVSSIVTCQLMWKITVSFSIESSWQTHGTGYKRPLIIYLIGPETL